MTVFVKFVDGKFTTIFRDEKAVNEDKLSYLSEAKSFYNNQNSVIDFAIANTKTNLHTFKAFASKIDVDSHNHLVLMHDIEETEKMFKKYKRIATELNSVSTSLDYCNFYCKYNNITYTEMEVQE